MIVTAFYTNTLYEKAALELGKSAKKLGYKCVLTKKPHLSEWTHNVNYKVDVIEEASKVYPGDSILYVDADAIMHERPTLLDDCHAPFACVYFDTGRPMGGTLWFRDGEVISKLIPLWHKMVSRDPKGHDDWTHLGDTLKKQSWKPFHLPPSYCWHEKTMRNQFPGAQPVIEHFCIGKHDYEK